MIWNGLIFERTGSTTAVNILFLEVEEVEEVEEKRELKQAYISKYSSKQENQVILLVITDCQIWHYLAVTKLSAVLKKDTPKH